MVYLDGDTDENNKINLNDLIYLESYFQNTEGYTINESKIYNRISFDRLNPLGKRVKNNPNALALIVGVEDYKNTNASALYADNDAKMFKDYASEKLGIPVSIIKVLLNVVGMVTPKQN